MCTVLQQHLNNQMNGFAAEAPPTPAAAAATGEDPMTSTPAPSSSLGRHFARHISPVRLYHQPTYSYLQVSVQ